MPIKYFWLDFYLPRLKHIISKTGAKVLNLSHRLGYMSQQKYVYNTQSLQFERHRPSVKQIVLMASGYLFAILFTAFIIFIIADIVFPSPKEKALKRELDHMQYQYVLMTDQVNKMSQQVEDVQLRDADLHRFILGMDPIDESVWEAGIGGADRYKDLALYPSTAELLVSSKMKIDEISRKLSLQLESLSKIEFVAQDREKMLASIPSIKPVREDLLASKVKALSGFGIRLHPVHKVKKMHAGIDFTAPIGSAIQATGDGKVISVKSSRVGYGNSVIIDHGYGFSTLYGHMSKIYVNIGDEVVKGQKIGSVGNTGTSTAPHLHYEVRVKGNPVDPIIYVLDDLSPNEYQQLVERASVENQSFD